MTREQVVTLVSKTLNDKSRRRKNVIVTGMSESSPDNDARAFLSLCEEQLTTKPVLSSLGTKRLGRETAGATRPRRLLVHLETEEAATELLRSARMLRSSVSTYVANNIFINADLSAEDQKLAYQKRLQRRSRGVADDGARPVGGGAVLPSAAPITTGGNTLVPARTNAQSVPIMVSATPSTTSVAPRPVFINQCTTTPPYVNHWGPFASGVQQAPFENQQSNWPLPSHQPLSSSSSKQHLANTPSPMYVVSEPYSVHPHPVSYAPGLDNSAHYRCAPVTDYYVGPHHPHIVPVTTTQMISQRENTHDQFLPPQSHPFQRSTLPGPYFSSQ